jgi:hypothetical protein
MHPNNQETPNYLNFVLPADIIAKNVTLELIIIDGSIPARLSHLAFAHPVGTAITTLALCLVTTFLVIRDIFTPIGKRRPPSGKQWHLPPGPSGIPIFGSLLDLKRARKDLGNKVVSDKKNPSTTSLLIQSSSLTLQNVAKCLLSTLDPKHGSSSTATVSPLKSSQSVAL